MRVTDPLALPDAPKFNDDFSNYFVINNMPKVGEDKLPKLVGLIGTTLNKKKLQVEEEAIDIPINKETGKTDGVAFIKMRNEEDARLGVTTFEGIKLGGNTFATCLFPEFEKIMNISDTFSMPQAAASFEDLRAPVFDIKSEQYIFKHSTYNTLEIKNFVAKQSYSSSDDTILQMNKASDKPVSWSPQGTYCILIKPEKV